MLGLYRAPLRPPGVLRWRNAGSGGEPGFGDVQSHTRLVFASMMSSKRRTPLAETVNDAGR